MSPILPMSGGPAGEKFDRSVKPVVACVLVTILAVPIWFFGLIEAVNYISPIDNPAGLSCYFALCLIMALPAAVANACLLAPVIALPISRGSHHLLPVLLNFGVLLAAGAGLYGWLLLVEHNPRLGLTIIFWYLAVFLLPPVFAGSLAYSFVLARQAAVK